jgi:hypothetical protein
VVLECFPAACLLEVVLATSFVVCGSSSPVDGGACGTRAAFVRVQPRPLVLAVEFLDLVEDEVSRCTGERCGAHLVAVELEQDSDLVQVTVPGQESPQGPDVSNSAGWEAGACPATAASSASACLREEAELLPSIDLGRGNIVNARLPQLASELRD